MKVLIGFEYTAEVREAFARRGHDAWSCDLLASEKGGNHYQCDILQALDKQKWDLIGLHTPCTGVALCGNRHYGKGMKKNHQRIIAIEFTKLVWEKAISICDKVYYENPKNVMGKYIGKHTQAIQPYQFGHTETKETWLWLHGLKPLIETNNVYEEMMLLPIKERHKVWYASPSETRGQDRSRTYPGIAKSMADQWG